MTVGNAEGLATSHLVASLPAALIRNSVAATDVSRFGVPRRANCIIRRERVASVVEWAMQATSVTRFAV